LHEVVALDLQILGPREVDRGRVVNHDVDATKLLGRLFDGLVYRLLVADVAHYR
jgi:hypothetical protein